MGKPLHDKVAAFEKHLADVERSCVATFSNEHLTRARVEAIEADLAKIKAYLWMVEPKEDAKTNE